MARKSTKVAKKFRLVLINDLTESMGARRVSVRRNCSALVQQLFASLPAGQVEAGVISIYDLHRDGGDDFTELLPTANLQQVLRYIADAPDGCDNGTSSECYERALHRLRDPEWEFDDDSLEVIVFTGDAVPHPRCHPNNEDRFDWKHEAQQLTLRGALIYPVFVPTASSGGNFWEELAEIGNGGMLFPFMQFELLGTMVLGTAVRLTGSPGAFRLPLRGASSYASQRAMQRR